jgi:Glutaredoxin-like domain (DUF836)
MGDFSRPAAPLPDLVLYSKPGCGLCDEASENIERLLGQRASLGRPIPRLIERDITTNAEWERAYLLTIPVLELGDRRVELATSLAEARSLLADVLDRAPSVG